MNEDFKKKESKADERSNAESKAAYSASGAKQASYRLHEDKVKRMQKEMELEETVKVSASETGLDERALLAPSLKPFVTPPTAQSARKRARGRACPRP